jgi:hypothetical protein
MHVAKSPPGEMNSTKNDRTAALATARPTSLLGSASTGATLAMKYNYRQTLQVRATGSDGTSIAKHCTVGIRTLDNERQSRHLNYPLGTVLYTVGFGNRSDALVPEESLSLLNDDDLKAMR